MAKAPAETPEAETPTASDQRTALFERIRDMGTSGIRLSADKAWLRPAIVGAVESKVKKALDDLDDAQVASIAAFLDAAL